MSKPRIRKTGLPPGSLIYTGIQKSDAIIKDFVRYNSESIEQLDLDKHPDLQPGYFYWLDVRGIHNPAEIEAIGKRFSIDTLLLEDILDPEQRPKFEDYDNAIFIIMKNLIPGEDGSEFLSEQICLYLTDNLLITFEEYPDDSFQSVKVRMQSSLSRIRNKRPDYLMYAIIDFITDHYFHVLDICNDRIHALEGEINKDPDQELKKSIYHIRQDISDLHRIILATREAVSSIQRTDNSLVMDKTRRYFRDIMDNIMQIMDINDNQNEHLSSLHDLFMSEMTYRMTNVMKILTVITSIFIPLTFITSVYGMNFKFQPEYNWPWAYPTLWGLMFLMTILLLIYFKRQRWL
ncbi:MAG TPA: magnesium/cobalt transporter CorA [Saprospiraceae bacterium]|nr:magnesium/cobalt transporter CorA [Saprospiraceae bacterium]